MPTMNERCLTPEVLAYLESLYGLQALGTKLLGGNEAPDRDSVVTARAQYGVFMSLTLRAKAYWAKQGAGKISDDDRPI